MSNHVTLNSRSLSDSLRCLADRLDVDNISHGDRAGVAAKLHALAHDISPRCGAHGDAPNSLGTERCELAAGHEGRHRDGLCTWPQRMG